MPTQFGENMVPAQNWLHTKMHKPMPMKKRTAMIPPLSTMRDAQNTGGAMSSSTPAVAILGPTVSQMAPMITRAPMAPTTVAIPGEACVATRLLSAVEYEMVHEALCCSKERQGNRDRERAGGERSTNKV